MRCRAASHTQDTHRHTSLTQGNRPSHHPHHTYIPQASQGRAHSQPWGPAATATAERWTRAVGAVGGGKCVDLMMCWFVCGGGGGVGCVCVYGVERESEGVRLGLGTVGSQTTLTHHTPTTTTAAAAATAPPPVPVPAPETAAAAASAAGGETAAAAAAALGIGECRVHLGGGCK